MGGGGRERERGGGREEGRGKKEKERKLSWGGEKGRDKIGRRGMEEETNT